MRRTTLAVATCLGLILCPRIARGDGIASGAVDVEYHPGSGMRVSVAGVPLIRGSSVQLHEPDWKTGYYSSNNSPPSVRIDGAAKRIIVHHVEDKKAKLDLTETIELVGENRLDLSIHGTLDSDIDANVEWTLGYLNAFPFHDAPIVEGSSVELHSRVGNVTARLIQPDGSLTVLDGRTEKERWWTKDVPSLWLGCQNIKIEAGKLFEMRATIEISPSELREVAAAVTIDAKLQRLERAFQPPVRPVLVIPKPKRMELLSEKPVELSSDEIICAHESLRYAAETLSHALNVNLGVQTRPAAMNDLFVPTDPPLIAFAQIADGSIKAEGYQIRCAPGRLRISASDSAGFRNATHTIVQLASRDVENGNVRIPACEIDDEPSLTFRGVHIFPGKDSLDLHRKLIEGVIAPLKFNHVVIECEYTQWDSARGAWTDISVPKDQLAAYVKIVRDAGLEPIPLVSSLGHAAWMFKNGQNAELMEDPETPWAYDATNPRSHEFMDAIYDEAAAIFKPKYFHVGHDEVTIRGRYPHRDESKKWGTTKLFLHDLAHWDSFLKARNVQVMLWGDMLLSRDEIQDGAGFAESADAARERRERLPKDAIICDWHYDALVPEQYSSLKLFKEAGFQRVIASSWFNSKNIYSLANATRMFGSWGLLQTTWAGYNVDQTAFERELKQFSAYVLAGEYAWSADSPPPEQLPYRADDVLLRWMHRSSEETQPSSGFAVDLTAAADHTCAVDQLNLSKPIEGYRFQKVRGGVVLDGALLGRRRPRAVTLKLDAKARGLVFLHATKFMAPGDVVGTYVVNFSDKTSESVPLRYGRDIRAWDDRTAATNATSVRLSGSSSVHYLIWQNPHPDVSITSIQFSTQHPYASPMLFGITGLDGPR